MALKYYLALNTCIGAQKLALLKKRFDRLSDVFKASKAALQYIGLTENQAERIREFKWKGIEADINWHDPMKQQHIITIDDEAYPDLLKEISSPPIVLYIKGDVDLLQSPQLAMVGTRKPSPRGQDMAFQFAKALASYQLTITSGLAYGVDAASHEGALEKGSTLAVLGAGLENIYPKRHQKLADQISEQGALVSEFPLGESPKRENFPRRNRIISGLSMGVLVIEAAVKSGSLITARYALEQGREVFAMPGSIHNTQAKGCHKLIKEGAILTETVEDVLSELTGMIKLAQSGLELNKAKEKLDFTSMSPNYNKVLACIDDEAIPMDRVIEHTGFSAAQVSTLLLELELAQLIKSVPGGYART